MNYKLFFREDLFVYAGVLLVLALCCLPLFGRAGGNTVLIQTPEEQLSFSLAENRTVTLDKGEYPLTIEIKNGKACVISAACPERICMHTPAISKSGESIVCLPARVSVQIQGERGDGLDEIVG